MMRTTALTEQEAWSIVDTTLGLSKAGARGTIQTPHGVPQLSGTVERVGGKNKHEALIHVKAPAPGLLLIGAYSWGGSVLTGVNLYLYGKQAPPVESLQNAWSAWLDANLGPVKRG